ncbi:hypothetical protein [Streptomyces sp. NPDC050416]|uniref:hypothetical protein n=1 Tax=Streptomyces sp. NPDC050416 TaxID=3365611 RepID=UPI0037AA8FBB
MSVELATNALVHGESRFKLTLFAAHGVLRCEVADTERRSRWQPQRWASVHQERPTAVLPGAGVGPGKTVWFELGPCGSDGCGRRQP